MIQDRDLGSNLDMDDILSLLARWDAEYCMDTPSTFHMRISYVLKNQIHDPDTTNIYGGIIRQKLGRILQGNVL